MWTKTPEDEAEFNHVRIYNEKTGTADPYMWDVCRRYGPDVPPWRHHLPKGQHGWNSSWKTARRCTGDWISGIPMSPSVLVKVGVIGTELYAGDKVLFQPTPSSNGICWPLLKQHITQEDIVQPTFRRQREAGAWFQTAVKPGIKSAKYLPGIEQKDGIAVLKKYNIHLIDCAPWRTEQSGYRKAKAKVTGQGLVTPDDPLMIKPRMGRRLTRADEQIMTTTNHDMGWLHHDQRSPLRA